MADGGHNEIIIVRRYEEEEHETHSSAWKVAHADFMTAMMAFFLIMWLINVTDDEVRKGISEYFNPIHLSSGQTDMKGLNAPDPNGKKSNEKSGHAEAAPPAFNPVQLAQGHADTKSVTDSKSVAPESAPPPPAPGTTPPAASAPAPPAPGDAGAKALAPDGGLTPQPSGDARAAAAAREQAAFEDPYAVLAKLATTYAADHADAADIVVGDQRRIGVNGGEVDRDPFDPVYWHLANVPPARSDSPGPPGTAPPVPPSAPDAAAVAEPNPAADAFDGGDTGLEKLDGTPIVLPPLRKAAPVARAAPGEAAAKPPAEMTPTPIASWLSRKPAPEHAATAPTVIAPAGGPDVATVKAAAVLKHEIAASVARAIGAGAAPMLSVQATSEGILIDLTDDTDFTMFEVGSAIPNARVVVLMAEVAKALAGRSGNVVVRGHTDGRPFHSDLYDNWRLSAARAQMAHYMLVRGGLDDSRIVRIEGYADRDLKVPADPLAAENRRIEILLQEAKP